MKLLVTGAGGQLGMDLVATGTRSGDEVLGLDRSALDITNRDAVHAAVLGWQPHAVVNCAAYNAVDGAETDPDGAYAVNALAIRHLREAAARVGAHLVHVSSDFVFDGAAGRPYVEWDPTNPLSVYGRSKLGGETEAGPDTTVVRTAWLAGAGGRNFVTTMLRLAEERDELTVVDDQVGSPTFTADLAPLLRRLANERRPGLFHATNGGATSKFGLATDILGVAGRRPERVKPVSTSELVPAPPAPRPPFSVLDNAALRASGVPLLPDYHEPLERLVKELIAK